MAAPRLLERSVEIAAPVEDVYAFHLDARNAALISPPGARVSDVAGPCPLTEGAVVEMRIRAPGLPVAPRWRVRVAELRAPLVIVDVAERSPFAEWRHEHRFQALDRGRTLMTDRVAYRLPGGPLGRAADRLVVRRRLAAAFAERHRRTRAVLEARATDA